MAERPHTKNLLMFENASNSRGFVANNYFFSPDVQTSEESFQVTFNKACLEKSFGLREPEQIISVCYTLCYVLKMVIKAFYMP